MLGMLLRLPRKRRRGRLTQPYRCVARLVWRVLLLAGPVATCRLWVLLVVRLTFLEERRWRLWWLLLWVFRLLRCCLPLLLLLVLMALHKRWMPRLFGVWLLSRSLGLTFSKPLCGIWVLRTPQ